MSNIKIPMGTSRLAEIPRENYYFVDEWGLYKLGGL